MVALRWLILFSLVFLYLGAGVHANGKTAHSHIIIYSLVYIYREMKKKKTTVGVRTWTEILKKL